MRPRNHDGRVYPNYTGEWLLSEKQVDSLEIHHSHLTLQMFQLLDSNFRVFPENNSNWLMLGQHFIELLQISDPNAFQTTCNSIVESMMEAVHATDPFVAASIAEAGLTKSKQFEENILAVFLKQNSFGLFPFATGFLNLGDPFSTLWALRLVALAGVQDDYKEKIEKAVSGLKQGLADLEKVADFSGFLLYVLIMLGRDNLIDKELIESTIQHLLYKDQGWLEVNQNLRQGGFVAYDLMFASDINLECMRVAEGWLEKAFELQDQLPRGTPKPFTSSQKHHDYDVPSDVWIQGYLRSLCASALYLRLRRPSYSSASFIVSNGVRVFNQFKELGNYYIKTKDYLPMIERIEELTPQLNEFWDNEPESFSKSVFISRWMGSRGDGSEPNPIALEIANAIKEELEAFGFKGRFAGDKVEPYSKHLWDNNEVYMRGCKYGIAIFEGMPGNVDVKCGTNHNVLVETGFMWGKGAEVLILRDPHEYSVLPTDLQGILHRDFDQKELGLIKLREAVREWIKKIYEDSNKGGDNQTPNLE